MKIVEFIQAAFGVMHSRVDQRNLGALIGCRDFGEADGHAGVPWDLRGSFTSAFHSYNQTSSCISPRSVIESIDFMLPIMRSESGLTLHPHAADLTGFGSQPRRRESCNKEN